MSVNKFYNPDEAAEKFSEIIPVFIEAFAGDPWFEVTKCVDEAPQRCLSGLSATALGAVCNECQGVPSEPAYNYDELSQKFRLHADSRPTVWYTEELDTGIALAGFASNHTKTSLIEDTYSRSPDMDGWLDEKINGERVVWIHEVFADVSKRPSGNLANFEAMCAGFMERLGGTVLAYCTLNTRMVYSAQKVFGDKAKVFEKQSEVPDRRNFVLIKP